MTSLTVFLSTDTVLPLSGFTTHLPEVIIYPGSTITFCLTGIQENVYKVNYAKISFGDGNRSTYVRPVIYNYRKSSISYELLYNKVCSVCTQYTHTYTHTASSYYQQLSCETTLYYSNLIVGRFIVPIRIAKSTFFSDIDEMKIIDSQIVSLSSSPVVLVIEQEKTGYTNVLVISS